ncbi:JNK1/MAPK8-associated membrane protein [Harmonia axyridis]|uniref:JNK1/MAPK8-associated membrane protein n=1 Tax=Harmonia axyridis TaxID=115357 RepID=UPI001E27805E|nr:JNK1/MAPK8-associated membrane protein [Harmonia axyridis]
MDTQSISTMKKYDPCPGWYCGRQLLENNELSECASCPRGYRRNETTFLCMPCTDSPTFYDWLYLGFIVIFLLILHWFFIDMVSMRRSFSKQGLILHMTATFEVFISSILSLLIVHPFGSLEIKSCSVRSLADWYTLLHNPNPYYTETVHCTQEAVYPMYSIVCLFYTLNLTCMLLLRPWVCKKVLLSRSTMSIYAAMYYLPILGVSHALIGGLLYYAFPYLIVVMSVISCAVHFAFTINQTIFSLVTTTLYSPRNVIILLGHWCLHAYGIISITEFVDPLFHSLLILLVPFPTLFYIFTARFTNPKKFDKS